MYVDLRNSQREFKNDRGYIIVEANHVSKTGTRTRPGAYPFPNNSEPVIEQKLLPRRALPNDDLVRLVERHSGGNHKCAVLEKPSPFQFSESLMTIIMVMLE